MDLSTAGLSLLKASEGFRSNTYLDIAGIPTIGYGHRLLPNEHYPYGLTEPEASALLIKDISEASTAVERLVKVQLTQGQYDALVDFTFNLGAGRLAGSTLLKDLNASMYRAAGAQLLLWDHSGDKEVAALQARRKAEYQLWNNQA